MILAYNQGKFTVEQAYQMSAYQLPLRKAVKWYKKAFDILPSIAIVDQ